MKETRYFYVPNIEETGQLPDTEATHATRVLRLGCGDEIWLTDGQGQLYQAEVTMATGKHCFYQVKAPIPTEKTWHGHIHLAIAPTKMIDRIEWMVEKATEIGFDEITFLNCQFSERRTIRTDRLEKIILSAMKQSHKAWLPKLNGMTSFKDFIHAPHTGKKFIAHCYDEYEREDFFTTLQDNHTDDIIIMVGPEGDFSTTEVQEALKSGFQSISLGQSRLRTETAGLSAVMMSQLAVRNAPSSHS